MILKNNKGFTAVEVVVGVGLMAILTTVIVSTQLFVTQDQMKLRDKLEDSIDTNLAERIIFSDLNNAEPSYNNLNIMDDKGVGFFDYYPDVPVSSLGNNASREVVLTADGARKEIAVLVQDIRSGALMNYDPSVAYNIGPTPDDFNMSASLEFVSINKNNWVKKDRQYFWEDGKVLMLDTPARIRPMDNQGNVDMMVPPRSPIFVGNVQGQNMNLDNTLKSLLNIKHPDTGVEIGNADTFLRTVPAMGGGIPLIRLRAVRLIKYYLVKYEDKKFTSSPSYLYKTTYEKGEWSPPFLLADKVKEFRLLRDSVVKRMIYFKVKKMDEQDKVKTASL